VANELKKYSFKQNSYWIYWDSTSGAIDSQIVTSYTTKSRVSYGTAYTGNGGQCEEYGDVFSMHIASYLNGIYNKTLFFSSVCSGISFGDSANPTSFTYLMDGYFGDTLINYSILGHNYEKVYRHETIYPLSQTGPSRVDIYVVENVGIVKKTEQDTINGTKTWNLLRFHTIHP
jgi:hypothetical protein